jgi:hypothetical protein
MLQRWSGLAVLLALTGSLLAISPSNALAQGGNRNTNRLDVPISGVVAGVGDLTGTFSISRFTIMDGVLTAVGTLTATVTNAAGVVVRTFVSQIAIPVTSATGTCDILTLVLGPLHLDLLGLTIDLNQVVLEIAATAGAGNLLGNLLCAIAGLLDAGSLGQQLVDLLNQLLGVLAGL